MTYTVAKRNVFFVFFFFKQKTAYEMRISDWSSDVCSSDLTQIGQMALGQAEQVGYSNLVEAWLGIQLDKGARFTDWSRRPLDKRQIDYAIGDVTHLAKIFPMMLQKRIKNGRGHWLDEEMEKLADP